MHIAFHSYQAHGTETPTFWIFVMSYFVAPLLTWAIYPRHRAVPEAEQTQPDPESVLV